ncbi:MAG: 23S rRNA (guanosine(2251)-2'-O)-methyltransferase RlmB [Rhodothermales bacterium]|nr:23S rRNA (guanosine(2251)-2'-O)-methyltransferase RlmB [Rhodothermales bacterium]
MTKNRINEGQSVLYGRNPVMEAIENGSAPIEKVLLQKGSSGGSFSAVHRAANRAGIPVQFVPKAKIDRLVGQVNHQGVAATTSAIPYTDVYDVLKTFPSDRDELVKLNPRLVFLDRVTDPHNLGAVIRSALAFGASAVLVPAVDSAPLNAVVVKSSAGAALRMPICRVSNPVNLFQELKERGFWIFGAEGAAENRVENVDWARPTVVVVGSEGEGIRSTLIEQCDYLVSIKIDDTIDSLNVSVAAGVVLFEAAKGRYA